MRGVRPDGLGRQRSPVTRARPFTRHPSGARKFPVATACARFAVTLPSAIDTLKGCELFRGFTDVGLMALVDVVTPRQFPSGTPIFVESMVGDSMFVVSAGGVRISARSATGEVVALGELGPGDWMGELSLLKQGPRMCSATATTAVEALELRAADFQKLLATKPQACAKLLMRIATTFGDKVRDTGGPLKSLVGRV